MNTIFVGGSKWPDTYIFITGVDVQVLGGLEKCRQAGDVVSHRAAV
jgi:hypothetical protein